MEKRAENEVGTAYGFFYFGGSREEIEGALPRARAAASAPSEMELVLCDGVEPERLARYEELRGLNDDPDLIPLADAARQDNLNYVIRARLPGASNLRTAKDLGDVENELYQSSLQTKFHRGLDKFDGEVPEQYLIKNC